MWDTIEFPGVDQKAIGKRIDACSGETETVENPPQNTSTLNSMSFMTTSHLLYSDPWRDQLSTQPVLTCLQIQPADYIHVPNGFSKSNALSSRSEYSFGS